MVGILLYKTNESKYVYGSLTPQVKFIGIFVLVFNLIDHFPKCYSQNGFKKIHLHICFNKHFVSIYIEGMSLYNKTHTPTTNVFLSHKTKKFKVHSSYTQAFKINVNLFNFLLACTISGKTCLNVICVSAYHEVSPLLPYVKYQFNIMHYYVML